MERLVQWIHFVRLIFNDFRYIYIFVLYLYIYIFIFIRLFTRHHSHFSIYSSLHIHTHTISHCLSLSFFYSTHTTEILPTKRNYKRTTLREICSMQRYLQHNRIPIVRVAFLSFDFMFECFELICIFVVSQIECTLFHWNEGYVNHTLQFNR